MTELDFASLDRTLAPMSHQADWDDVMSRFRVHQGRRRRRLLALAAAALVAVVGTASAIGSVRDLILHRGFVGLPPIGATPSAPESGNLVLSFYGRSATFEGRLSRVWVYADGGVVWDREAAVPGGANEHISGLLEQRLTPEGVELLRSEVTSAGLFDHDRALLTNAPGSSSPTTVQRASVWGAIEVRKGDRLVRLSWKNPDIDPGTDDGTIATPEELGMLERVDALITNPASWLPASAWEQRAAKAYVASRYATCWSHNPTLGPDRPTPSIPPSRLLALLPQTVAEALRHRGPVRSADTVPPTDCSVVPTEEARAIARALGAAGFERGVVGRGIDASIYGLTYRIAAPVGSRGYLGVWFEPVLPHGEWVCTPCG
jgi:hypothetical protein